MGVGVGGGGVGVRGGGGVNVFRCVQDEFVK